MTVIFERTIEAQDGAPLQVQARHDSRLRRNVRWTVRGDTIEIRAPRSIRRADLDRMVTEIVARVQKQRQRARKQQATDLQARAEAINRQHFGGELAWHTIRWVSNMEKRLGSCTTGGSTDGDIRISDRMRSWPAYVVDYVIAHELAHRKHADHSPIFWEYLARYPHMERARGFIEGVAFAENTDADTML
jgi:predicted metal-dependent hydrolase